MDPLETSAEVQVDAPALSNVKTALVTLVLIVVHTCAKGVSQ